MIKPKVADLHLNLVDLNYYYPVCEEQPLV